MNECCWFKVDSEKFIIPTACLSFLTQKFCQNNIKSDKTKSNFSYGSPPKKFGTNQVMLFSVVKNEIQQKHF